MQTYRFVALMSNISQKPFLQCFTFQRIFSASRVMAEIPMKNTIYHLLRSLRSFELLSHWLQLVSLFQ